MRTKYLYGKPHHQKYPHWKRLFELFDKYLEKIRALSSDHRINNLVVDLRNETCSLMDEIYQHLSIELRHGLNIEPTNRKQVKFATSPVQEQCGICGEQRVVNRCHIIPREDGGSNAEENVIYLCANHHFLFDQARLSEVEFNRIDVSGKAKDSVEFFRAEHTIRHQMYWRYQTNKSTGCVCGSLDFYYDVIENGNFAQPCLVCNSCGERWFMGVKHPLVREMSIEAYGIGEQIDDTEKQEKMAKALASVRIALAKWLRDNKESPGQR